MEVEGKFQVIPDISREDIVGGDGNSSEINYCNIMVMDTNGIPFIANESFQANYRNPVEITSGFFSAIDVISKEIKNKELQLITFSDKSSVNMININIDYQSFKICVEPSLQANWLLPNFIRGVIDKNIEIFQNQPDLLTASTEFYKKINIDIHKGTVATKLYLQGGCWNIDDAAVLSPSGYLIFHPKVPDDLRIYIESRRKFLSALVELGVKGAIQLEDSQGAIRMEYTLQLYHIQGMLQIKKTP
ncbi:MAG: hypothetical protein RBG13Loki_0549 [Promethearchaeota archaeon CR_4]|nr:MAG: hypothetical protein RBG13Loki_0549 [Candidatus Lokiarchaeota archaeon CR_4]